MAQNNTKILNYTKSFTALFIATGIGFSVLIFFIFNIHLKEFEEQLTKDKALHESGLKKDYIQNFYRHYKDFLFTVEQNLFFKNYLQNPDEKNKHNLIVLMKTIAKHDAQVTQLRYIDQNGLEKIRIDRDKLGEDIFMVPEDKLQDKKHRGYFVKTVKKAPGELFVSKLDLNIENKKIERPLRPVWRFAIPVYNGREYREENFKGILIVNVFGQYLLEHLTKSDLFTCDIYDQDGHILVSNDKNKNQWTRYLKTKPQSNKNRFIKQELLIGGINDETLYIGLIPRDYMPNVLQVVDSDIIFLLFVVISLSYVLAYYLAKIPKRYMIQLEAQNQKLFTAKKEAERANAAKSEFLANMSHEIRTPLNGIIGLTELSLEMNQEPKEKSYLEKIKRSSCALLNVINDILDYSKIEAGKLDIVDSRFQLNEILNNVSDLFSYKAYEKGIDFLFLIDPKIPNILVGDSLRLTQILNNLIGNALKFTQEGHVIVKIERRFIDENKKTVGLKISIKDSGIGISEENRKKLFKAFNQVDSSYTRKYGGTGLGLKISKQLVELLGGTIDLQSKEGEGSEFSFKLRFKYLDEQNGFSQNSLKELTCKKFLVVDDNKLEREYLKTILKSWKLNVDTAAGGKEAVELLEKKKYDIIFVDYDMPVMNGLELIEYIKQHPDNSMEIFMVSAYAKDEISQKAARKNIQIEKILTKPYTPSCLFNILFDKDISTIKKGKKPSLSFKLKAPKKALLVEDNKTNQLVASKILGKIGFEVDFADDGSLGVSSAKENYYDIIFMDLQMPNMDGFEATKRIKQFNKTVPIIALSAAVMEKDKELTQKAGMQGHIAKPIDRGELYKLLSNYFELVEVEKSDTQKNIQIEKTITIDGRSIGKLQKSLDIGEKPLLYLYEGFKNDYKDTAEKIETLDEKELLKLVHKLKGSSGSLRLDSIFKTAQKINDAKVYTSEEIIKLKEDLQRVCIEIDEKISPKLNGDVEIMGKEELNSNIKMLLNAFENYEYVKKEQIDTVCKSLTFYGADKNLIENIIQSQKNKDRKKLIELLKSIEVKTF